MEQSHVNTADLFLDISPLISDYLCTSNANIATSRSDGVGVTEVFSKYKLMDNMHGLIPSSPMVFSTSFDSSTVQKNTTIFLAASEDTLGFSPPVWHSDVDNSTPTSTPTSSDTDLDLITWAGPNDPANPKNWSISYKWILMSLCAIMTVNMCVNPDYTAD